MHKHVSDYLAKSNNDIQRYFAAHNPPTYFYYCFFGELVKIWGIEPLIPKKNYDADDCNLVPSSNDDYSYKDQISYILTNSGGKCGWFFAFKEACTQCNLIEMYQYYESLDLIRRDVFDGVIADQMIEILFDSSSRKEGYFVFLISKRR